MNEHFSEAKYVKNRKLTCENMIFFSLT